MGDGHSSVADVEDDLDGSDLRELLATIRALKRRVEVLEGVVAGAGTVLAHAPDPCPRDSAEQRLEVLEATVTGAGAILRDVSGG